MGRETGRRNYGEQQRKQGWNDMQRRRRKRGRNYLFILAHARRQRAGRAENRIESKRPAATALLPMPQVVTAGETPPGERRMVASGLSIFRTESYGQEVTGTGRACEYQATRWYSVAQRSEALGVFIVYSVSLIRTGFSIFSYPSEEVYTFLPHVASTVGAGDQRPGRGGQCKGVQAPLPLQAQFCGGLRQPLGI